MSTYEIVDTSDNKIVSTFAAETIKYFQNGHGILVVGTEPNPASSSAGTEKPILVAVIPLTPNRFIRRTNGGTQ